MDKAVQLQASLFSYTPVTYEEYHLVIHPDAGVANDLSYIQKKASEVTDIPASNNDLYIPVATFYANADEEATLANQLRSSLKGKIRVSFIWLDNYFCHASGSSIFVTCRPTQYFKAIQEAVYPALILSYAIEKNRKINFEKDPGILIAKGSKKRITELWQQFRDRKYENKFIVDTLSFIKKDPTEGTYRVVAEIKL